jgi:hypothetical protein
VGAVKNEEIQENVAGLIESWDLVLGPSFAICHLPLYLNFRAFAFSKTPENSRPNQNGKGRTKNQFSNIQVACAIVTAACKT